MKLGTKTYACGIIVLVMLVSSAGYSGNSTAVQDQDDVARQDIMRSKMMYSKNILEGLAAQDFDQIRDNADKIADLTRAEKWLVNKGPEYDTYSLHFRRAAEALSKNAKEKNLDGATLRFNDMTTRCVDCHSYMRGRKKF